MSAGYTRRYLEDPGLETLLEIEGTVIIDMEPPANVTGLGSGTVIIVGEFEDGCFDDPTEVFSGGDLQSQFGGFGYAYDGVSSNYPCAVSRSADSAVTPEYWNGNGFIALVNKRFRRLIVCRADTTVGSVEFTRLAAVVGGDDTYFDLEPAQTVVVSIDGAAGVTATFDAAKAVVTSAVGSYPTGFAGGESMVVQIDQEAAVTVTFQATDTTQALVIARINSTLGYTAAADAGGGVTTLSGIIRGTDGGVVLSSVHASITTQVGFSNGTTPGTGDVADIDEVTLAEAKSVIEADIAGTFVDRDVDGKIRISRSSISGTTRTIEVDGTSTATGFGFTFDDPDDAFAGSAGIIPAGTRVQNSGGAIWVLAETLDVTATSPGPYSGKVRPATDDGTALTAGVGTVNTMTAAIESGSWSPTNTLALSAALTEAQIDAKYLTAIDKTLNPNKVCKEGNIIVSARQSNAIRQRLRSNAIQASGDGMRGRIAIVRPPLGTTTRATARGSTQPGVGAYRDQRVVYAFPGARTFVPQIAARGTAGGTGFTADGNIDVGFDTWVASTCSQLAPEENPGQQTSYMSEIISIETGNSDVSDMTIDDYKAFKLAGIAALRMGDEGAIIQSGKTSVNPSTHPNLQNINRRRMADYIQDTLAVRTNAYSKKLATRLRRKLVSGEINGFLNELLSPGNEAAQRIDGYSVDPKTGNTVTTLAAGLFRIIVKVRTTPSLDVIVLQTTIGESVTVDELPLAA